MNRVSKITAKAPQPVQDGPESYYSATPQKPAKPAPQLSALELMYAYYDAA